MEGKKTGGVSKKQVSCQTAAEKEVEGMRLEENTEEDSRNEQTERKKKLATDE